MAPKLLRPFLGDVRNALLLAACSLILGLIVNQFRTNPVPLIYRTASDRLIASLAQIDPIFRVGVNVNGDSYRFSLREFQAFINSDRGLVVDARPEIFYRIGHVPGALSLPREEFKDGYLRIRSRLEANRLKGIAVYCSDSECEDSVLVQRALLTLGYRYVAVFKGGWNQWMQAQLPVEKGG